MNSHTRKNYIGASSRTCGEISDSELDSDSTIYTDASVTMNQSTESSTSASVMPERNLNDKFFDESDLCLYEDWRSKISKATRSNFLNETRASSILAGNIGITSSDSSDSYYSAQSTLMSTEESTTTNLNIALSESKHRDTNYNFDSSSESEASINTTSNDTSYYMLPFLERLSRELNICPQESSKKQEHLKRLSGHFAENPEKFKDRLMTIIEETKMTDQQSQAEQSIAKLNLLAAELEKNCKAIINESMPVGLIVSPTSGLQDQTVTSRNLRKTLKCPESVEVIDLCTPPPKQPKKVYRKTPKFVVYPQTSTQSPLCIATLKKNTETPKTPINEKTPKTPDSFIHWEKYCEENTTPVSESKKERIKVLIPNIICRIQYEEINRKAERQLRALEESDESSNSQISSEEESQLEDSILEKMALKRRLRYGMRGISLNSSDDNDESLLECTNRITLHKTPRKIARESPKKTPGPSLSVTPATNTTESNSPKTTGRKPIFFATPSSSCQSSIHRPRPVRYFSPHPAKKSASTLTPKKNFTGLDYYEYSAIKSPVAEYIKSTDTKLIQNIKAKTDKTLLTPRNPRSETLEILRTPLSQQRKHQDDDTENIPMDAASNCPKVTYKSASKIRDIRLSPSKLYGERHKILGEANNVMVIQHASRVHNKVADESIHVIKSAKKTNCLGKARKPWK